MLTQHASMEVLKLSYCNVTRRRSGGLVVNCPAASFLLKLCLKVAARCKRGQMLQSITLFSKTLEGGKKEQ